VVLIPTSLQTAQLSQHGEVIADGPPSGDAPAVEPVEEDLPDVPTNRIQDRSNPPD